MPGPLDSIRCLDLTSNAPGPFCTMVLGDLGADVIRVYDHRGVSGRRAEAAGSALPMSEIAGGASRHNALLRNKRSLGLDLKDPDGKRIFLELARTADVVVEGMRPSAAARLGVDYASLGGVNPRLVHCSLTGYGQNGPYAELPGHDLNYIGQGGALALIADGEGKPVIPQNLLADYAAGGLLAALGILAALFARERTGRGQQVDAAMTDGVLYLIVQFLSAYFAANDVPRPGNSPFSGGLAQYNVYEAQDGRYLTLGALEPWFYADLCRWLGREDLIQHGYDEGNGELRALLEERLKTRSRDEWFDELRAAGQCVGRVLSLSELEHDEQVAARQMVLDLHGPDGEPVKQVGIAPKLSETPGSVRSLADRPGEHTDEILAGLGLDAEELQDLRARGVVA
jgi:crotonobetainyl-CoA:carnitine CoA-transferase CaiB-like acyl-CoA transferase